MSGPAKRSVDEAIDLVANDLVKAARKAGNTEYTFAQARRRVAAARARGDNIRENDNR